jgi:hypothetical protein
MSLNLANQSRAYDATLRAVRFWGHDGATTNSEKAMRLRRP